MSACGSVNVSYLFVQPCRERLQLLLIAADERAIIGDPVDDSLVDDGPCPRRKLQGLC